MERYHFEICFLCRAAASKAVKLVSNYKMPWILEVGLSLIWSDAEKFNMFWTKGIPEACVFVIKLKYVHI